MMLLRIHYQASDMELRNDGWRAERALRRVGMVREI
jgi:hypothetical protein